MFSPLRCRPLYSDHSSGRWLRGSHCPNSSRKENTRSFARAFSSSRRAPPNTAPNRFSVIPRSNVTVCSLLRGRAGVVLDHAAGVDVVLHAGHDQPQPVPLDRPVPELDHLVEVLPRVHVHHRERHRRRPERLHRQVQHHHRVLAAGEQQPRTLDGRRHLAEDLHRLGFQPVQMRQLVRRGHPAILPDIVVSACGRRVLRGAAPTVKSCRARLIPRPRAAQHCCGWRVGACGQAEPRDRRTLDRSTARPRRRGRWRGREQPDRAARPGRQCRRRCAQAGRRPGQRVGVPAVRGRPLRRRLVPPSCCCSSRRSARRSPPTAPTRSGTARSATSGRCSPLSRSSSRVPRSRPTRARDDSRWRGIVDALDQLPGARLRRRARGHLAAPGSQADTG